MVRAACDRQTQYTSRPRCRLSFLCVDRMKLIAVRFLEGARCGGLQISISVQLVPPASNSELRGRSGDAEVGQYHLEWSWGRILMCS